MNSFGRIFRVSIFGESHGPCVGITIDGCPAGLALTTEDFLPDLERRKGGLQKGTTPRTEDDLPIFKSGIFNNKTTGAPLTILFENKNVRSEDYEKLRHIPRPGHADFVARQKFGGYEDYRGSGHFSGRLTVCLVAAGVVAKKLLLYSDITSPPTHWSQSDIDRLTQSSLQSRESSDKPPVAANFTNSEEQWKFSSGMAKYKRQQPTPAEEKLWNELRNRKLGGYKFRRQHPIDAYIPDFVCLEKKLVVEVDGDYHDIEEQKKIDELRTRTLKIYHYRLIRFSNEEVLNKIEWVKDEILKHLNTEGEVSFSPSPLEGEPEGEAIHITASILEIAGEKDPEKGLQKAIEAKDSVGGIVECRVTGLPAGLGEPFFDSVESLLSHIVFAIPAVRAIEFGTGFAAAKMVGSQHNDAIENRQGKTTTNHAGGVVGGISNGNELVFRIAVKPASSTPKPQHTLNWETGNMETVSVKGRHDLCIALRVPVILEAATAIVLADLMMLEQRIPRILL